MSLQNLFEMVKADRYTADGCEALNKAREADVEDRKYKNGEISETTGLMKTPKGWVEPPKGGRTPKSNVPGNKPLNNKYYKNDVRTEAGEKKILSETKIDVLESKVKDLEDLKKRNGGKLGTQGEKSLQLAKEELESRKNKSSENANRKLASSEKPEIKPEHVRFNNPDTLSNIKKMSNGEIEKGISMMEKVKDNPKFSERQQKLASNFVTAYKRELAKRGGSKSDSITNSEGKLSERGRYAYEEHAKKISNESLESLIRNKDKAFVKHNDEIADIFKKELERRKGVSNPAPDLRTLPQHLEQAYPQNMTITKEDEERFGKAALSGLSGPRESAKDCAPRQLTGDCKIRVRKS